MSIQGDVLNSWYVLFVRYHFLLLPLPPPPPLPPKRWISSLGHTQIYFLTPLTPPPLPLPLKAWMLLYDHTYVIQEVGCRCTLLPGNSSISFAGSEEQIHFSQQSSKMLKMASESFIHAFLLFLGLFLKISRVFLFFYWWLWHCFSSYFTAKWLLMFSLYLLILQFGALTLMMDVHAVPRNVTWAACLLTGVGLKNTLWIESPQKWKSLEKYALNSTFKPFKNKCSSF